jgi:RNA 3'-phosphate cyclase
MLSALTGKPFAMRDIRANRPVTGMRRQHVVSVHAAAALTGASVQAEVGSSEVSFQPGPLRAADVETEVGTAGSVTLVLQAVLPLLLVAPGHQRLRVGGGTDVPMAPPWDWFQHVLWPRLAPPGAELELLQRGFAPEGGGAVEVRCSNPAKQDLDSLRAALARRHPEQTKAGRAASASIYSVASADLAVRQVAERQAAAARAKLEPLGIPVTAQTFSAERSGSACVVILEDHKGNRIGGSALGAPRRKAERVGEEAADAAILDAATGATVDRFLADQWVPFVALGAGAVRIAARTEHLLANIETVNAFLGPGTVVLEGPILRRG